MSSGFDQDETGYYVRTGRGLWIRSHWCRDTGTIRLGWHIRYEFGAMMVRHIDENGDVMDSHPVTRPQYRDDPWVDVEPFTSLDRVEVMTMGRGGLRALTMGLMRHGAGLLAMGLGEDSREVATWLEFPERGQFVMPGVRYQIEGGIGAFAGLDGAVLTVESVSKDQPVKGAIVVDGVAESYPFEHASTPEFFADFIRSTTPID